MIEREYPIHEYNILSPESVTLKNCNQYAFTTDTCNQAYKTRKLFADTVEEELGLNQQTLEEEGIFILLLF